MTRILTICLISLLLPSCSAITPTAAVIGATASVCDAMDCLDKTGKLKVITPECLWYRKIQLEPESKEHMTREDKEELAYLNLMYDRHCL